MEELIKLATCTIDLADVSEVYDYEDHVLIVFGGDHDPFDIQLRGHDAEAMRAWLDADWHRRLAELDADGAGPSDPQARKRPRHSEFVKPLDIDTEPPF